VPIHQYPKHPRNQYDIMKLNIMLFRRPTWLKFMRAGRLCHLCHRGRQSESRTHSSFACFFCFSFCVCRRCHRHAKGNKAVLTAHHEKSTPRFNPILECKSKSMDQLASTTIFDVSACSRQETSFRQETLAQG
jgi:hypothetical protein